MLRWGGRRKCRPTRSRVKLQESSLSEPLAGQAALVTGGSRGIGLAIARRLIRLKARVTICARDAATLRTAAERLSHEGGEVFAFPADLRRAVAPEMIRRRSGHIINISSLAGKNAFAGGAIYCASKWGLQALSYCLAEELRGHGIRVSVVCPGTVATEFSPHTGKDSAKMLQPDD